MKATNLLIAIAAVAAVTVSGSVCAAGIPAANAAATTAAATSTAAATAQVSVAAKSVSVPAPIAKTGRSREEVRAEAVEAVKQHRATEASQFDWFTK